MIVVRDARAEDRPTLVRFMAELQEVERALRFDRSPGADIADPHLAFLEDLAAEHQGRVLVAELDGRMVGFLICCVGSEPGCYVAADERRHLSITDLYTVPAVRRRGVARALLAAAEAHAHSLGLRSLRLHVLTVNQSARDAYAALGMTPYEVVLERRVTAR